MQFDPSSGTLYYVPVTGPSEAELDEMARARTSSVDGVPVQKVVVTFLMGRASAEPHRMACATRGLECRAFIDGVETVLVEGKARGTLVVPIG